MKIKKTWFAYVIWLMVSCLLAVCFYESAKGVFQAFGVNEELYLALCAGGICIGIVLLFIVLHKLFINLNWEQSYEKNKKRNRVIETIILFLVFAVFMGMRIYQYGQMNKDAIVNSVWFQMAKVDGSSFLQTEQIWSLQGMYSLLLSTAFSFLGNRAEVVVYFQIALQAVVFFVSFAAIKRIAGYLAGIVTVLLYSLIPAFFSSVYEASPYNFILVLYSLSLLLFSFYANGIKKGKHTEVKTVLFSVFCALISAGHFVFCGFFAMTFLFLLECEELKGKKKAINVLLYMFSYGIVMTLFVFRGVLKGTYRVQLYDNFGVPTGFEFLILISIALLYLLSFWFTENEPGHLIGLLFVLTAALCIFQIIDASYLLKSTVDLRGIGFEPEVIGNLVQWIICFIAGIGTAQTIQAKKKRKDETEIILNEDWKAQATETKEQKIELIENPLPLPKKHEKKQMDYAFEPDEAEMHYDIELTEENAKFDIE